MKFILGLGDNFCWQKLMLDEQMKLNLSHYFWNLHTCLPSMTDKHKLKDAASSQFDTSELTDSCCCSNEKVEYAKSAGVIYPSSYNGIKLIKDIFS